MKRHKERANIFSCDEHCSRRFCSRDEFEKHQRSIRITADGTATTSADSGDSFKFKSIVDSIDLNLKIFPPTGYENDEGYLQQIHNHIDKIFSQVSKYKHVEKVNKQINSDFTYLQLRDFLNEIYSQQTEAYKINIGFGYVLYNTIKKEFKYYFNSSNNLLFEKAFTISNMADVRDFLKKIVDVDLINNYYLRRPSSGWKFAGLANVEAYIYKLQNVPIGAPSTNLPEYIRNSKSV